MQKSNPEMRRPFDRKVRRERVGKFLIRGSELPFGSYGQRDVQTVIGRAAEGDCDSKGNVKQSTRRHRG
jgi:hypothetical protein